MKKLIMYSSLFILRSSLVLSQGTWTPLVNQSPDTTTGVMLLLTDGRVLCKTHSGGGDYYGNVWDILTPDIHGSYVNGTWSGSTTMHDTRLYFSSQILKDGRVFVAGGEYGTGDTSAEIYNPLTDVWTRVQSTLPFGDTNYFYDANSEILPDGRVLEAVVYSPNLPYNANLIYNPLTNMFSNAPSCHGSHDETAWVKLKDSSILFIDDGSMSSERYIPKLNAWIVDGNVPDSIYDYWGYESGAAFLLPDGRAFFLGATGHTAYYTPSGNINPGTWAKGPDIPYHLGTPDAAASMMVNGNILLAVSPLGDSINEFNSPTSFFEFNYLSQTYTQVMAPTGGYTINEPCFFTNTLNLPDGTILLSNQYSPQCYVYTPLGNPLTAGKPTIDNIIQSNCQNYTITGKLFNGISEGSAYGDDWQCATNYPLIRLTSGNNVYYARTYNWNNTGVMTDSLEDTAQFALPPLLPATTYSLVVVVNGNPSNPVSFTPCLTGIADIKEQSDISVYPNPNKGVFTMEVKNEELIAKSIEIYNVLGECVYNATLKQVQGDNTINISNQPGGVYFYRVLSGEGTLLGSGKVVIE